MCGLGLTDDGRVTLAMPVVLYRDHNRSCALPARSEGAMMDLAKGRLRKGVTMRTVSKTARFIGAVSIVAAVCNSGASAQQAGGAISVDPAGSFNRQGQATISGTYSCDDEDAFAFIEGNLVQPVGRLAPVRGDFIVAETPCTGETEQWTATVQGAGQFRGGGAVASASLVVCPEGSVCVSIAETTEDVRLRR